MKKILFSSLLLSAALTLKVAHQDTHNKNPVEHSANSNSIGSLVRDDVKGKPDDKAKPADDKKPDDKKPQDKKPDDKKPEDKGKPDDKNKPDNKKPDDNKKPQDKKPDDKNKSDDKKPADKGKPDDKGKPEDKGKPDDKNKPADSKKPDDKGKPTNPGNKDGKVADPDPGVKSDKVTDYAVNCNSKGRCWQWCGDNDKLSAAKNDFHKQTDGKWCYTTAENFCKARDDCKNQTKCVDNCEARWGGN